MPFEVSELGDLRYSLICETPNDNNYCKTKKPGAKNPGLF